MRQVRTAAEWSLVRKLPSDCTPDLFSISPHMTYLMRLSPGLARRPSPGRIACRVSNSGVHYVSVPPGPSAIIDWEIHFSLVLTSLSPTRVLPVDPLHPRTVVGPSTPTLNLLPALEPWGRSFRRNLADLFLRRTAPVTAVTSRPGTYWPDVFVYQPLPWRRFGESAGYHALFIAGLYAISMLPARPSVVPVHTFDKSQVLYFSASEYLPPLDTGDFKPASARKADPELAKQPILSVPPEARNQSQTIVSPPSVQLDHDVATPNIVSWGDHSVPVPEAATERAAVSLASLNAPVVAPPPTSVDRQSAAPALNSVVIAPPPPVDVSGRRLSDINLAPSAIIAPAPQLPMGAQRVPSNLNAGNATVVPPPPSFDSLTGKASGTQRASLGSKVVPPPPPTSGNAGGADRLIALGIHPAALPPPPAPGNRQGVFAATPEGKSGASGTPGVAMASNRGTGIRDESGAGTASGKAPLHGAPSGLQVGNPPSPATSATGGGSRSSSDGRSTVNPQLMAKAAAPPSIPHSATPPAQASELERKVFGDRPFYSMTLNMPNLNSAGGSWIMRFAELHESGDMSDISAPRALHKVDPAYPLELMRQNVGGTVAVQAIIRTNGSVSDVHVLRSVDERLDRYACEALSRWQFEPATRSGTPVDLAVVVMIPFHPVVRPHF